jgi:hypothetical protein
MTSTTFALVERELERRAKHKLAVLRHFEEWPTAGPPVWTSQTGHVRGSDPPPF